MDKQITVVTWEDGEWFELYADGARVDVFSNHGIRNADILICLGIPFEKIEIPDNEDAEDYCGIKSLDELKRQLA
jgi:hypothetical protein